MTVLGTSDIDSELLSYSEPFGINRDPSSAVTQLPSVCPILALDSCIVRLASSLILARTIAAAIKTVAHAITS